VIERFERQALRYNFCKGYDRQAASQRASTMDEPAIYARLTEIFQNVFDDDLITATPALSAKDVGGWNSLTHIRLMLTVEKAFRVKFSTLEMSKMENVGDLVTLIKART
jgi:acyl carrier protein